MDASQQLILLILACTIALFLWGRWRHDIVALAALLACVVSGLTPAADAFVGFGHPAVITVAAVLILSKGLQTTGAVEALAQRALPQRGGVLLGLGFLTLLGAALSAFMNNVGAMALLMPIAMQLANRQGVPPGRVLMPLAFGTILGGMTTLIGTPPNLIVSGFRAQTELGPYSMFDFTPVGLAVALGGVILAFATADPKVQVFSDQGRWYLLGAAVASVAFVVHLRRAEAPLLPRGTLAARPAWGSVVVSFFVGAALIAALIDVPLFARTTVYPESQLMAALVLLRFLAALPVGAVVGGYLTRSLPAGVVTAAGMLMASGGFLAMSRWDITSLESWTSTVPLVVGGFGFGLALAPVNAAILASTADAVHGVASAMVVVARMVGMLVGISALTTIGLRRYYAEQAGVPPVQEVCPAGTTRCSEYSDLLKAAGIAQEQTVFLGAAGCALVAAVLALVLLRGAATRGTPTRTGLGIG